MIRVIIIEKSLQGDSAHSHVKRSIVKVGLGGWGGGGGRGGGGAGGGGSGSGVGGLEAKIPDSLGAFQGFSWIWIRESSPSITLAMDPIY